MRRLACALFALTLAACGPVPHPFEHEAPNPLIEDRLALSALSLAPVDGLPGLEDALIHSFENEDIPASTQAPGPGGLWLNGTKTADGAVAWKLHDSQGGEAGEISTPLPSGPFNDLARRDLANRTATAIAHLLRGEDQTAQADSRPHLILPPLKAPKDFDAEGLRHAIARALLREGFVTGDAAKDAVATIIGEVHITPPPANVKGGQDILEITWIVRSPDGKELGKVAQGNPVDHLLLTGYLGPLGRDIADAAAPGIAEVIHKKNNP